eukprot:2278912-Pyramimonas_sp.AAC.1
MKALMSQRADRQHGQSAAALIIPPPAAANAWCVRLSTSPASPGALWALIAKDKEKAVLQLLRSGHATIQASTHVSIQRLSVYQLSISQPPRRPRQRILPIVEGQPPLFGASAPPPSGARLEEVAEADQVVVEGPPPPSLGPQPPPPQGRGLKRWPRRTRWLSRGYPPRLFGASASSPSGVRLEEVAEADQ